MDSNNFMRNVGVGEREARVFSQIRSWEGIFGQLGSNETGSLQNPSEETKWRSFYSTGSWVNRDLMVRERHFGLGHGIGRSGDIAAIQVWFYLLLRRNRTSVIIKITVVSSELTEMRQDRGYQFLKIRIWPQSRDAGVFRWFFAWAEGGREFTVEQVDQLDQSSRMFSIHPKHLDSRPDLTEHQS